MKDKMTVIIANTKVSALFPWNRNKTIVINDVLIVTIRTNKSGLFMLLTFFHLPVLDCVSCFVNASNISVVVLLLNAGIDTKVMVAQFF